MVTKVCRGIGLISHARMRKFSVRPSVYEHIQKAVDYYDDIDPRLGEAFLDEIDASFERIENLPEGYQKRLGELRLAFLKRFPYGVSYKVYDSLVLIIAIFHMSQDPEKWLKNF